jgi:hypothetical protein
MESMVPVVTGQPASSGAVRQGENENEEAGRQRGEKKAQQQQQQQQQQHEKKKDGAREEEEEEEAQVVVPMRRPTGKRAKLKEMNQKQAYVAATDTAANAAATRPPPPGKPFKMSTEDDSWKENARAGVGGGRAKAGAGGKRKAAAEAGKSTAITGTKKRGRKRAIPKQPTAQPSPVLPGGIGSDGALMQFGDVADADHSLCGFSFLDSPGGMPMDMGNSLSFGIMNSENSISFLETALANQNKSTETK